MLHYICNIYYTSVKSFICNSYYQIFILSNQKIKMTNLQSSNPIENLLPLTLSFGNEISITEDQ